MQQRAKKEFFDSILVVFNFISMQIQSILAFKYERKIVINFFNVVLAIYSF